MKFNLFSKINVCDIVVNHCSTLVNANNGKTEIDEWITFLFLPVIVASTLIGREVFLDNNAITIIITALSILVGLLFNVIVLIFDIISRDASKKDKNRLLKELISNISYCILISIVTVVACVVTFSDLQIVKILSNWIVYILVTNFLFTVLMILKRIYKLFQNEITQIAKKAESAQDD